MTALLYFFATLGFLACLVPLVLIGLLVACHFIAKAKLRRDARLTVPKTQ
jgi:hypothetical protein